MSFKNLPLSFSFAESTVLRLQVNCKTFSLVILNGICLLALNIRVKTLRENYSCNYKHQLKTLKNNLKLNKWNNYQAYLCDNFWNKRKVEKRKFDCNSFRITGNTNFRKKLTSFVYRNLSGEIQEIRHTAGAEAVVFWPFSERLLWMNTEEKNNTDRSYFEKFIWKPKCFCTQMKFAYSSVMCPFKLN